MKPEKISGNQENPNESQWDTLAEEAQKLDPKKAEAKYFASEVAEIQKGFTAQVDRSKERGERHISLEEFEKWEDDYAFAWKKMDSALGQTGYRIPHEDLCTKAECQDAIVLYEKEEDLNKTVEAQAGHFYDTRSEEIVRAIREANPANAQELIDSILSFPDLVLAHVDYKYKETGVNILTYDANRTRIHNEVIERLNEINNLARQFGAKPLTARNFWPSNACEKNAQTYAISKRMRCDRDVVEEYYLNAFRTDIEKAIRDAKKWDDFDERF